MSVRAPELSRFFFRTLSYDPDSFAPVSRIGGCRSPHPPLRCSGRDRPCAPCRDPQFAWAPLSASSTEPATASRSVISPSHGKRAPGRQLSSIAHDHTARRVFERRCSCARLAGAASDRTPPHPREIGSRMKPQYFDLTVTDVEAARRFFEVPPPRYCFQLADSDLALHRLATAAPRWE
jgi:hypothetical protein